jgi:catechol 2,3-dioxygenase-like lactoylglutathione lyase family enzyme
MEQMLLNLTLAATDLEKTAIFYRKVLLLSPELIQPSALENSFLRLFFGKVRVVFQSRKEMEARHPALLQNLTRDSFGVGVQLELSYDNLDDVYRMIKYYDWPIAYELDDQEHRRRELWLHDPDGYLLVLNEDI